MMMRLDNFLSGIRDGSVLEEATFEVLLHDKLGRIKILQFQDFYVIVDNGYSNWSSTVPPFQVTNNIKVNYWSRWVESMRKDAEYTFRILKCRWRILKTGVRIH
jgi:hypothetical protein